MVPEAFLPLASLVADDEDDNGLQQGKQAVEEDLSSQLPNAAPNFTMKTTPVPSNGSFTPDPGR